MRRARPALSLLPEEEKDEQQQKNKTEKQEEEADEISSGFQPSGVDQ